MTRRGRELTAELVRRHQELSGTVTKAANLTAYYSPLGESLAVLEKNVQKTAQRQSELRDRERALVEYGDELLARDRELLQKAEAIAVTTVPTVPWSFGINGYHHDLPESDGNIPREPGKRDFED